MPTINFKTAFLSLISVAVSGFGIKSCKLIWFLALIWISIVIQLFGVVVYSNPIASNKLSQYEYFKDS
ncbi:CLUMA_CG013288, isoform A [Clunio marinus]|uniref:CLUMA_CG013288, isoform A n=1 Tax=Clunio marinus TaxID=568069 RepID=A0A1J1ILP7_9DIPT|nr:CLUMA_CG013288, isoform A [Clunio marinus]